MTSSSNQWKNIGTSPLTPVFDIVRAKVYTTPPKLENIIVIGSELHYNNFWWKMMFIAGAARFVRHSSFRKSDRVTIAYVDVDYNHTEKLAIEGMKRDIHYSCSDVNLVKITSIESLINILNKDRATYKIQDLVFFCHGLNSILTLNLDANPQINFKIEHIIQITKTAFSTNGKCYSYACRTGIAPDFIFLNKSSFSNLNEAKPNESLAQKMANYFDIEVHAFYKRTDYSNVIRPASSSDAIVKSVNENKEKFPNANILTLIDLYEAFKHDGLSAIFSPTTLRTLRSTMGQRREGVAGYALWRKGGGQSLPVAANSPTGLPDTMAIFTKSKG